MYVVTQLQNFSHNLATIQVSELQMPFVTFTQTNVHVVYLKFLQISTSKINYYDLFNLMSQYLYYLLLSPYLK